MIVLETGPGRTSATFGIIGVINTQQGGYFYSFSLVAREVLVDAPVKFSLTHLLQTIFIPVSLNQKAIKARRMFWSKQASVKTGYVLTAIIDNEGNKQSGQMTFSWFSQVFSEKG